ncbi:SpaA isopeptide-forming pilin-related protein [Microbacterium sp. SLBN-111]|uniref:SpaA isopeptide-forming pilin-related protein n=1 Tax=Microbacterium sp. SLBN-111 TaxID=3377733 RepID=UPI003C747253
MSRVRAGVAVILGALLVGAASPAAIAASENPEPAVSASANPEPAVSASPEPEPTPRSTETTVPASADAGPTPDASSTDTEPAPGLRSLAAAAATPAPQCRTGYAYAVLSTGEVKQIAPGASTSSPPVVTAWSDGWKGLTVGGSVVSSVNGLAVDVNNGQAMYAYERSSPDADEIRALLRYTPSTGVWDVVPGSAYKPGVDSLVAGAVNLSTGTFIFGGFSQATFQIFQWDPATGGYSKLGYIKAATGQTNGDLAFDRFGNLYIVGSASKTTIYTVAASTLAAAVAHPGDNELPRSETTAQTAPLTSINGLAFRPDGRAYISNASTVALVDPATWASPVSTATPGSNTDLASCDSPTTLTILKSVTGRVNPTDQFTLSLVRGLTNVASVTTSGTATGLQSQQIGPIPVVNGTGYAFTETAASGSLADYSSSYRCVDDDGQLIVGSGAGASITIPNIASDNVVCTITNAPLIATVAVHKTVQDITGQNPAPGSGWTLGAATTATTGTATMTPSATTQVTPASGDAAWRIAFDALTSRATVKVSESVKSGWDFVAGTCTVTSLDGSTRTVTLPVASGGDVTGVAPGDAVACTITNKPSSGTLTLRKVVDNTHGGSSTAADWTLTGTGPQTVTGKTGAAAITDAIVAPGTYALSESGGPAGYAAGAWSCAGGTVTGSSVAVAAHATVVCTVTNSSKPGAVTWTKTAKATRGLLAGSEWTLTGPGLAGTVVKDCAATPCTGLDQDPAPGAFRLENLAWGSYAATETRAPVGYVAAGSLAFTVSAATAGTTQNLGAQTNEQQKGPALPLAGGTGADAFVCAGGVLLVLSVLGALRRARRRTPHS